MVILKKIANYDLLPLFFQALSPNICLKSDFPTEYRIFYNNYLLFKVPD